METRGRPRGKRHAPTKFAPTSCGPLFLNSGPAQVFEINPNTGKPIEELPSLFESNELCLAAIEDVNGDGVINRDGSGDEDGDGLTDLQEACEIRTNPCNPDTDGDLVPDDLDNCPLVTNADQFDIDSDGLGDVCDPAPFDPNVP